MHSVPDSSILQLFVSLFNCLFFCQPPTGQHLCLSLPETESKTGTETETGGEIQTDLGLKALKWPDCLILPSTWVKSFYQSSFFCFLEGTAESSYIYFAVKMFKHEQIYFLFCSTVGFFQLMLLNHVAKEKWIFIVNKQAWSFMSTLNKFYVSNLLDLP